MEPTPWDPEGVTVVLDPDGQLVGGSAPANLDTKRFYKLLVAARCLDLKLSRLGLPMWASAAGEEAALIGAALVAREADWIFPGFRDEGVALGRGIALETIIAGLFDADDGAGLGRFASAQPADPPPTIT